MKKLMTLLVLAAVSMNAASCGKLKGKEKAKSKGGEEGQEPEKPGPSEPIAVDQDVEKWANDAISALELTPAAQDAAKPYESCSQYYDAMTTYAKAMQAIYVKRYLAWARYQLAVSAFSKIALPMPGAYSDDMIGGSSDGGDVAESAEGKAGSDGGAPSAMPNASQQSSPTAPNAVASEYQTNNQEVGVDETDYVKSNGQFVAVANGNLLRVFDLAGQIKHAAQIVGEYARGLHLVGNKLVLITSASAPNPHLAYDAPVAYDHPDYWWGYWGYYRQRVWYYSSVTNVHEFAIQADGTLAAGKVRKYYGDFRDGREIGGTLHLVMQKNLPWHILNSGLELYLHPSYVLLKDDATLLAYAQRIAEENLNAWRSYMFEEGELFADHRASYKAGRCRAFTRLNSGTADQIVGSELLKLYQAWDSHLVYRAGVPISIYSAYPVFPSYDHVTSVASIDLEGEADSVGMTLSPVNAHVVYASKDNLVVGNHRYQWYNYWRRIYVLPATQGTAVSCIGEASLCQAIGATPKTGVVPISIVPAAVVTETSNHFDFLSFKLAEDGATPTGIGTLPGTPINNYAIDAGPTTLRFVVTEQQHTSVVPGGVVQVISSNGAVAQPINQNQQVSYLNVMKLDGSDWKSVNKLALDIGSWASGVRFLDNAAFVSTSNQGDPLYAVDLTDEANPKLAGKMPDAMRTSYFHPMGDGKTILALGRGDALPNGDGYYGGYALNVAMIDVENLAAPKVLGQTKFQVGYSNAEHDFKSFRFIPRLGLLVVPLSYPFRLELLAAKRDAGFAHFGAVTLQDKFTGTYGIGGSPRTMLFDDLLVGVFGNQDVGAELNYKARSAALVYAPELTLTYKNKVVAGFPYYWYLEGVNEIAPKWRSATLIQ